MQDWVTFRVIRNLYNEQNKEEKIKCDKASAEKFQDWESLNLMMWLLLAKSILKNDAGHASYHTLKVNNDIVNDDHEKAQVCNDFFLENSRINDSPVPLPDATCHADNTLSSILIGKKDIEDLIESLDITKAIGPDQISQVILKKA